MKRVGYALVLAVALLTIFTLALAQFGARNSKYLYRVLSGRTEGGYFGSSMLAPAAFSPQGKWVAVSASGETMGFTRTGSVLFFDSTLANSPVYEITAPAEGLLFGWAISGGGDWNGDGFADLVVGAPAGEGTPADPAGSVYFYLGGEQFGAVPSATLSAGEAGDQFGEALDLTHDINSDGLADLIVGAPHSHKAGATAGRAYIWWGRRDGVFSQKPDVEIGLGTMNDEFGCSIAAGDLTGDGVADLVIGARQQNRGARIPGAVLVFQGGTGIQFNSALLTLYGESTAFQDFFGESVAILPDVNGDGIGDLLVGAPQVEVQGRQVGRAYLYYGGMKMNPQAATTLTGTVEAGRFGEHVYALGDLNQDRRSDYAVQGELEAGARGVMHFYSGESGKEFHDFSGENGSDRLGSALAVLDSSFGGRQILVGARWCDAEGENAGRVYVLRIE